MITAMCLKGVSFVIWRIQKMKLSVNLLYDTNEEWAVAADKGIVLVALIGD